MSDKFSSNNHQFGFSLHNLRVASATLAVMLTGQGVLTAPLNSSKIQSSQQQNAAAMTQWGDEFDGAALDTAKWERFALEGTPAGESQVASGQLKQTGASTAGSGVRSKNQFGGDRFLVEATLAKIAAASDQTPGDAVIAVLFDADGRNRIEWSVTSGNRFEARRVIDGKAERLDARQAGGAVPTPKLGIGRRGDDFFFTVNDQLQFQKNIAGLPRTFRVALYGANASANDWDAARVVAQDSTAAAAPGVAANTNPGGNASSSSAASATSTANANVDVWTDDFTGDALDMTKWERYSIDGVASKTEVKDGQLRLRGADGARAGVRSKKTWRSENFYVEATIANVGQLLGAGNNPRGFGILTILLGSNVNDRIEWVFTSDNQFEAWATTVPSGRIERLDNRNLATREEQPRLGIRRNGNQISFLLNGQVGLTKTINSMPKDFRIMLYGFSTSQNDWDVATVQTPKQ